MSKRYNFTIHYTDTRYNKNGQGAVSATSIVDAKNRFKAAHPYAKIIACVKGAETYVARANQPNTPAKSGKQKKAQQEESSSLGSMLLGAAVTAGVGFLANKWLNKDKA